MRQLTRHLPDIACRGCEVSVKSVDPQLSHRASVQIVVELQTSLFVLIVVMLRAQEGVVTWDTS